MYYEPTSSHRIFLKSEQLANSSAWNLASYSFFDFDASFDELEKFLNVITERNDALRMKPIFENGEVFLECEPFAPRSFERKTFDTPESFLSWAQKKANTSVLHKPGMWDAYLIRVGEKSGVLNVGHHAMSDGLTVSALNGMIADYFRGKTIPESSYLPHLASESAYRRSPRFERDYDYWKKELSALSGTTLFSDSIAADKHCRNSRLTLDKETSDALLRLSKQLDLTEASVIYAAVALYFLRLHEPRGFTLGIPVLGRTTQAEMKSFGLFMHILPMPIFFENQSFQAFAENMESRLFDLFRHQRFTSYDIQTECTHSDAPLFDVTVDYSVMEELDGFESRVIYSDSLSVPLELHFLRRNSGEIELTTRTLHSLFFDDFSSVFVRFLSAVIRNAAAAPSEPIARLSALLPEEEKKLLRSFNRTENAFPANETPWSLFEMQAVERPDKTAISCGDEKISFQTFRDMALKTDVFLRGRTSEKQSIAVIADRSVEMLTAVYGITRGGNAYVPISPDDPPSRINEILRNSACSLVLAQEKYLSLAKDAISIEMILAQETPPTAPAPALMPNDTLYEIYTSGSTGTPKGVAISTRSVMNRIFWMQSVFPLREDSVILLKTPYTFDVSVWEIFWWSMFGGQIHLLPSKDHYRQSAILQRISSGKVTDIHFVPSVFSVFLSYLETHPEESVHLKTLRNIYFSGETLYAALVNRFRRFDPDARIALHNLYGPAECTIDVTCYTCETTELDPLPIGKPIFNTQIYLLDRFSRPVPAGAVGELCIAGENVGKGYVALPELTAVKFVKNPFGGGRLYHTGDLAFWRADGNICFAGRRDNQFKVGGRRIEAGEIETALLSIDGIKNAIVIKKDNLSAFFTGRDYSEKMLRRILSEKLPAPLIPAHLIHVAEIPLSPNGKTDRNALENAIFDSVKENSRGQKPQTPLEAEIVSLFGKELNLTEVFRDTDFLMSGGTSLGMVKLLSTDLLRSLTAEEFMTAPTPAGLANALQEKHNTGALTPLYVPENTENAYVLFPYAGGSASAFSALTAAFKKRRVQTALYVVSWDTSPEAAAAAIQTLSDRMKIRFYSHCAGSAKAMSVLQLLSRGGEHALTLIAGGNIPPGKATFSKNPWEVLSDSSILRILKSAGLTLEDLDKDQSAELVRRFRTHTDFYTAFFASVKTPVHCTVLPIVSRKDLFTKNYRSAQRLWKRYATTVEPTHYIDSPSHYFQNAESETVADILLEKIN